MKALLPLAFLLSATAVDASSWQTELKTEIPHRVLSQNYPFSVEYNSVISRQLDGYLRRGRRETQRMLSRSAMYFPIIEHYLAEYGLPDELKYIPLLESRMKARAESPVGAVGLWQFMPATARHYGLRINDYVDERKDPYLSTGAAISLLKNLYEEFGDWALALAAYNCGPGRVRSAIRRARCDDFWEIKRYLPRQTQRYVPSMVATIYVAKDYKRYGITPDFKAHRQQPFRVFKIQRSIHLDEIARHCNLPYHQLQNLNPGYQEHYIPASRKGHYLILPEEALSRFRAYLIKQSRRQEMDYAIAVLDSHRRPLALSKLDI